MTIWSFRAASNLMFTGLIQDIGRVAAVEHRPDGRHFRIECPNLASQIAVDDSVATNGVCLTATAVDATGFSAEAIAVTLEKTGLGALQAGDRVNLELAMRFGDRVGGHWVQGHVTTTGRIIEITETDDRWQVRIAFPAEQRKYLIKEGSIAVDGISLTVADLDDETFTVCIIPHTLQRTVLADRRAGDRVNLEVDVMAKYIENFLRFPASATGQTA